MPEATQGYWELLEWGKGEKSVAPNSNYDKGLKNIKFRTDKPRIAKQDCIPSCSKFASNLAYHNPTQLNCELVPVLT